MEEEIIIKQIVESANVEAEQILKAAIVKAKEIEEKNSNIASEKAKQQFEIEKNRILKLTTAEVEKAEFDDRSAELIERKRYIEIVKEKVKQKIMDLDSEEYIKIISEKLQQYKNEINVEVVLPNKCYEQLKRIAENIGAKVLEPTDEFDSGVIVKCGCIEYNYNFEENMEFMNEIIEKEINNLLFQAVQN